MGPGELASGEILPAFGRCKFARPTVLVGGDRAKAEEVAARHGIGRDHLDDDREAIRLVRSGQFGPTRPIEASNGQD